MLPDKNCLSHGTTDRQIPVNIHVQKTCLKRPLKNRQNKYLNDK